MSEQDTQNSKEAQKTVIAFIAGLLIGGLLVWIFGGTPSDDVEMNDDNDADIAADVDDVDALDETETELADNSNDNETDTTDTTTDTTTSSEMQTGDGSVSVADQSAGSSVAINSAVFPTDEGWIGVRDYVNGQMGSILGVARYSKEQGLIPDEITLLRPTQAGTEYAVVFFSEDGDRDFSLAGDAQIGGVYDTFRAQ